MAGSLLERRSDNIPRSSSEVAIGDDDADKTAEEKFFDHFAARGTRLWPANSSPVCKMLVFAKSSKNPHVPYFAFRSGRTVFTKTSSDTPSFCDLRTASRKLAR